MIFVNVQKPTNGDYEFNRPKHFVIEKYIIEH